MSCSTNQSSDAPAAGTMATQFGNGLSLQSSRTQESLARVLVALQDSMKMASYPRMLRWSYVSQSRRHVKIRGHMGFVSAIAMEEGHCPLRAARGYSFGGEYYLVDRRRAKRTMRKIADTRVNVRRPKK